jgi:predicted DNA-binding transcriptional regulator AlpA
MPEKSQDVLWSARSVRERLDMSRTTLWRLRQRPGFPAPVIISGRLYWKADALLAWAKGLPVATQAEEEALRQRLPGYRESANA